MDVVLIGGVQTSRAPAVVGVVLNDRATHERLAAAFLAAPYHAPPKAPVLYLKPRNTHAADGATVRIPADPGEVQVNATIGLVLGRRASRIAPHDAPAYVAGYRIASDLSLPHTNLYRPAVRERCRDGFLPMAQVVPTGRGFDLERAQAVTRRNGIEVDRRDFATLLRPAARLLAAVTEFMTLEAGDVLLLGAADRSPLARAGDAVSIEVAGLGRLSYRVELEAPPG